MPLDTTWIRNSPKEESPLIEALRIANHSPDDKNLLWVKSAVTHEVTSMNASRVAEIIKDSDLKLKACIDTLEKTKKIKWETSWNDKIENLAHALIEGYVDLVVQALKK